MSVLVLLDVHNDAAPALFICPRAVRSRGGDRQLLLFLRWISRRTGLDVHRSECVFHQVGHDHRILFLMLAVMTTRRE